MLYMLSRMGGYQEEEVVLIVESTDSIGIRLAGDSTSAIVNQVMAGGAAASNPEIVQGLRHVTKAHQLFAIRFDLTVRLGERHLQSCLHDVCARIPCPGALQRQPHQPYVAYIVPGRSVHHMIRVSDVQW